MAFADVTGDSQAVLLLQRSLERGRLAHAYLFTGDSVFDLEALARTLVKALNCQSTEPPQPHSLQTDPCDHCSSCRRIDQLNHPDILWVRPESKLRTITIDQIRDVMHAMNLKPTEAAWKAAVIVAAERMNVQAANAFLKTLEEPPPRSLLILLSGEPQRLLDTIRSRCLRLNLGSMTRHPWDESDRAWLARFGAAAAKPHSSLLSRYQLLDGLLARLAEIRSAVNDQLSASSPLQTHDDIDPALRDKWEEELNAGIEAEYRKRRAELLEALHWWMRDVWLKRNTDESSLLRMPELGGETATLAGRLSPSESLENLRILERTRRLLDTNVQEALALEVGLLRLNL